MIGSELGGRYRIIEELGKGGMAVVYLAEHLHLKRKEAIKILNPALAGTKEFVSRFRREARATNRLQHPNIVTIYDFGQLPDGRFYLAMEYADGENLKAGLRRLGALPVPRAVQILQQLASAIDHAHARGVIHRDLKPANMILVEHRGHTDFLKVLDFGIAKIIAPDYADSVGVTRKGGVFGTPGYMAPEQFQGEGSDPRIDIYALGCIGFELLVGEPPFRGGWAEVMAAIAKKPVPLPSQRRPQAEIPDELDALILRCLDKDPARRFQTGKEVAAAIAGVPGAAEKKSSSGRPSFRFGPEPALPPVPEADDFEEESTDAATQKTRSTARDLWETLSEAEDLSATGPTSALSAEAAQFELHQALHELAELLVDLGCSDFQLSIGVTDLNQIESDLERYASEMEEMEAHSAAAEQRTREREASLRFAIGELRFERDRARARNVPVDPSVDSQITELERRLAAVASELEAELARVTDRGIALAAARARKEDELLEHCRVLDRLIDQVVQPFQDDSRVAQLHGRLRTARAMVEAVEHAQRRRT